jgi:hypothetical protein
MVNKDTPQVQQPRPQGPQADTDLSAPLKKGASEPTQTQVIKPNEER